MQLVQGGCFQPDCAAPLGRRRMAQKPALHFWRRHSALRVCRLRPAETIGEYARKRTRACGRRRLRTELVRTAVRSRQGIATARPQARLRVSRRKAAGVAGAAGTVRLSGPRPPAGGFQRMAVGRFGLPAHIRFRRFQTDFAGRAEGPAENPAGRGLCGVLLSGRERPVAFPVCARGESS